MVKGTVQLVGGLKKCSVISDNARQKPEEYLRIKFSNFRRFCFISSQFITVCWHHNPFLASHLLFATSVTETATFYTVNYNDRQAVFHGN